jgi:hypothetical protein
MEIRAARPEDAPVLWAILEPTIRAGETYALPRDLTEAEAIAYWMGPDRETFVAEEDGRLFGTSSASDLAGARQFLHAPPSGRAPRGAAPQPSLSRRVR